MKTRLILILLCCQGYAFAQQNSASKAWKIYGQYVEKTGGMAHWRALESYRRVSSRTDGLQVTSISQKPDQFQLIFEWESHRVVKSYDGQNGWLDIDGRYEGMRPGEEIEMAEEPEFYEDLLLAKEKGFTLSYEGKQRIGKSNCHKLKMQKSVSDAQWYWINTRNLRLEMTGEFSQDPAHDGIFYTTRFEDYRQIDGYEIPFTELLMANGRDTLESHYTSTEINPELDAQTFSYRPKNQRNCVLWMQDDLPVKIAPAYTFVQQTVRYDEEIPDTTIWYEALVYPDHFRIDFDAVENGNCNLNVGDTLYIFRKHEIRAKFPESPVFLFMEGGIYAHPIDEVMKRLHDYHVDTNAFQIERNGTQELLVFGNAENKDLTTQVKIDLSTGLVVHQFERLEDGKLLELIVSKTQTLGEYTFPKDIEIFIDGSLVQREIYLEIDSTPNFPAGFFDPTQAFDAHWYKAD